MAVTDLSGETRTQGVAQDGKRVVDIAATTVWATDLDTFLPDELGLNQVDEVWVKVDLGGTPVAPAWGETVSVGAELRFIGS